MTVTRCAAKSCFVAFLRESWLIALTESHLACHTYPEHGTATFNLYCCQTRPEWDWDNQLTNALGASAVTVQRIERGNNAEAEISNWSSKNAGGRE